MSITVGLVDEHEIVRRGVAAMLRNRTDRLELVSLDSHAPSEQHIDLALCDVVSAGRYDTGPMRRMVADPRVARVAAYTWRFEPWRAPMTLAQGVSGYLSKSLRAADLVEAILAIHGGRVVISPASRQVPGLRARDSNGVDLHLTGREAEVLSLITAGMSNAEIADHFSLSINSVKSYIRAIYRKIDVDSRAKAVLWGLDNGLATARVID